MKSVKTRPCFVLTLHTKETGEFIWACAFNVFPTDSLIDAALKKFGEPEVEYEPSISESVFFRLVED